MGTDNTTDAPKIGDIVDSRLARRQFNLPADFIHKADITLLHACSFCNTFQAGVIQIKNIHNNEWNNMCVNCFELFKEAFFERLKK